MDGHTSNPHKLPIPSGTTYASGTNLLREDPIITSYTTTDVRFPTSLDGTGSDAMNAAGDYSAAYVHLHTSIPAVKAHGMTFTIGRGNDIVRSAIPFFAQPLVGHQLSTLVANPGLTWSLLTSDSQIRWIGPEKGVTQLALGAVVNALWDLWARCVGKPVWRLVCDMTPQEIVSCIPFRYLTDFLTPHEALSLLESRAATKSDRLKNVQANRGVRCYTTSAGWLGYPIPKMRQLLQEAKDEGFEHFKLKVGGSLKDDQERLAIAREIIGPDGILMVDANQVWDVPTAVEHMRGLAAHKPWFIEEPTSPDDVLGHKAVREALTPLNIGVATGEMCQNRVIFKQLIASDAIDIVQVDACRLGGMNEVLAVLLMAAKKGLQVVPHSGGVGLPEYTQHIALIDYLVASGKTGLVEFVDHLHEHYVHPSRVEGGWVVAPQDGEGYSIEMKEESLKQFAYPGDEGSWWKSKEAEKITKGSWH